MYDCITTGAANFNPPAADLTLAERERVAFAAYRAELLLDCDSRTSETQIAREALYGIWREAFLIEDGRQ